MSAIDTKYSLYEILKGFETSEQVRDFLASNYLTKNLTCYEIDQLCWTLQLNKRLADLNIDSEKFCALLKKHDMKITGSFVLQIIEGSTYEKYDIDIFVTSITKSLVTEFEKVLGVKAHFIMEVGSNSDSSHPCDEPGYSDHMDKHKHKIVNQLVNFDRTNKNINCTVQLIEPHKGFDTITKYVDSFDLDVCKNFFDGDKFYVCNLKNIQNKRTIYDEGHLTDRSFITMAKRLHKYKNRGYEILFSSEFIKQMIAEQNTAVMIANKHNGKLAGIIRENNNGVVNAIYEYDTRKNKNISTKFDFVMECLSTNMEAL